MIEMNIIFGTGRTAEKLMQYKDYLHIKYFVDNDEKKQQNTFFGYTVYSPLKLTAENDYEYIVIASDTHWEKMKRQCISDLGIRRDKIIVFQEADLDKPLYMPLPINQIISDTILKRKNLPFRKGEETEPFCIMADGKSDRAFALWGKGWLVDYVIAFLHEKMDFAVAGEKMLPNKNVIQIICDDKDYGTLPEQTIHLFRYLDIVFVQHMEFWGRRFHSEESRVQGVITGISYFRDAVKSEFLRKPVINLASDSQDLYYDFCMFQDAYQKFDADLQFVVIGLAPYSLRYDESLAKYESYKIFRYYELFSKLHNNKSMEDVRQFIDYQKVQIDKYIGMEICETLVKKYPYRTYRDIWRMFDNNRPWGEEDIKSQYHKPYEDTQKENISILTEFLSYCEKGNIKIYIMLPPFTNWYKSLWDITYYYELISVLEKLHENHNFILLDFTKEQWKDEYFYDHSHLNMYGAKKMADILNEVL